MAQLALEFDSPSVPLDEPEPVRELTIQERFERFHAENPHVYTLFRRFAIEARAAGRGRFGSKAIWERLRWYTAVETQGEPLKLNNVYTPYYARLLTEEDPSFLGFFEFRRLISQWED